MDSERYLQDWIDGDLIELEGEDRYHGPVTRVLEYDGIADIAGAIDAMRKGRVLIAVDLMIKVMIDIEAEIRKDAGR